MISPAGVEMHGKGYLKRISRQNFLKNAFDEQKSFVKQANVIFDVGANVGNVATMYSKIYPGATIYAFDPLKEFANCYSSLPDDITFSAIALSDIKGTIKFNVNKSLDTSSILKSAKIGANSDKSCEFVETREVMSDTIDSFCNLNNISTIDILKMDVQGGELAVLKGAKMMLNEHKVKLIYTEAYFKEQYVDQPLFYDTARYLKDFGYELMDIYEPYYNERQILWCDAIFVPV